MINEVKEVSNECDELKREALDNVKKVIEINNAMWKRKVEIMDLNEKIYKEMIEGKDVSRLVLKKFKLINEIMKKEKETEEKLEQVKEEVDNIESCFLRKLNL